MNRDRLKENVQRHFQEHDSEPTIVLYSPDMDLCMSLRMLLQDDYRIVTTTDVKMLTTMVRAFQPDLVIVDGLPIEFVKRRFESMKKEYPDMHIMFFYASLFNNSWIHGLIHKSVDAAFSKPIELSEIMESIRELVPQHA
jgi:DNA-binding response OmpR family regulator